MEDCELIYLFFLTSVLFGSINSVGQDVQMPCIRVRSGLDDF